MKISFKNDVVSNYPNNWGTIIMEQLNKHYSGDLNNWISWLENEWQCKAILGKYEDTHCLDTLIFTDESYLMAVIKFGSPSSHLSDESN